MYHNLSILLMDMWALQFGVLQIMPMWTFLHISSSEVLELLQIMLLINILVHFFFFFFGEHAYAFLLDVYLRVELLDYKLDICLFIVDDAQQFSKVVISIYTSNRV